VEWLHRHPFVVTCFGFALAAGALLAIAFTFGFGNFEAAWQDVSPAWLAASVGAGLLSTPAYVIAYRAVAAVGDGPKLPWPLALRIVIAGFGPVAIQSGFVMDRRALRAIGDERHEATVRVLGLGALEWALLASVAWVDSVILLLESDRRVPVSILWPWAIAVPLGLVLGLWLSAPGRRRPALARRAEGIRHQLELGRRGLGVLHDLVRAPRHGIPAFVGAGLYWTFEIACFYCAVRFAGARLTIAQSILAFATGFALTRRSSPFAGVGVTEVLMTFALNWVRVPISTALVAVIGYRIATLVIPSAPAILAHRDVRSLVESKPLYGGSTT
jgi:uncharacterized membrane protein YbhN (UPF0104 family)